MTEEKKLTEGVVEEVIAGSPEVSADKDRNFRSRGGADKRGGKGGKSRSRRPEKEAKEFFEEVLNIARVTRVVKGGRRMRFFATVAVGDKKGRVGIGTGKSVEVSVAVKKAVHSAKKNLVTVPLVEGTIPYDKRVKFKSAKMLVMPAPAGTGVIAGGAFRKVAMLAGITDIYSKSFGTTSSLVCAQAAIKVLGSFPLVTKRRVQEEV